VIELCHECVFRMAPNILASSFVTYLKIEDSLAELLAFERVTNSDIKAALSQTHHLGSDSNPAFIQKSCCIFVAFADLAENVCLKNLRKR